MGKKFLKFYFNKNNSIRFLLIKLLSLLDNLALFLFIGFLISFSLSTFLAIILLILAVILFIFDKKITKLRIIVYSNIILHELQLKNPNIPDKLFDDLYSEIKSLRNIIKDLDFDIFDFYMLYFKYFIKNKNYFDIKNIESTRIFLEKSNKIFLVENINSLQYLIVTDHEKLKRTKRYTIILNSINNLIGYKFNFDKPILEILKDIYKKINQQKPSQVKRIFKLMWGHPLRTLMFIFLILYLIYVVLSFFGKDASKIIPLFEPINNLFKCRYG